MNNIGTEPHIIGGVFGLQQPTSLGSCPPPFLRDRHILLLNARSGISLLVGQLSPPQVWVPSYLCGSILEAVDETATRIRFYDVNYDLVVPSSEELDEVQRGDLVILIDYFGFPCDASCATRAREQGAWVLEDACQALLSGGLGRISDFLVFSPRKFLGVPDGGILALNRNTGFDGIRLKRPPAGWWLKALSATVLRREFDIHGGSRRWFELFQETEAECPLGPYAMSELTETLLMHTFDYSTIATRRVDNYHSLAYQLRHIALRPDLPPDVVPLGFPVRVRNRDGVRQRLFEHGIYPPVHWPIQDIVPTRFTDSHRLASEVMTLPCDQRYESSDMNRMAQLVLQAIEK